MKPNDQMKPKIGLVLGSGSARGWSHIGVIHELERMGIKPDIITGCSIGAFVGAAYATDNLDLLENWAKKLTWKDIVNLMDVSFLGGGFLKGERILLEMQKHFHDVNIEDIKIPFGAVATDLYSGSEIWLKEGSLLDAVRASMALPGVLTPFKNNGRWLVDGGLVNPVPVSLCRAMGAEVVIAVNLNGDIVGKHLPKKEDLYRQKLREESEIESELYGRLVSRIKAHARDSKKLIFEEIFNVHEEVPGLFEITASSINIMQDRITRSRMAGDPPEVTLSPRLAHIRMLEFDKAEEVIVEGMNCVRRMETLLTEVAMFSGT